MRRLNTANLTKGGHKMANKDQVMKAVNTAAENYLTHVKCEAERERRRLQEREGEMTKALKELAKKALKEILRPHASTMRDAGFKVDVDNLDVDFPPKCGWHSKPHIVLDKSLGLKDIEKQQDEVNEKQRQIVKSVCRERDSLLQTIALFGVSEKLASMVQSFFKKMEVSDE